MEKMKKMLVAGAVLACVAPAMGVFYQIQDANAGNFGIYNYNNSPDETAMNNWLGNNYQPPFTNYAEAPFYEYQGAVAGHQAGPNDEVRFARSTADAYVVGIPFNPGTFRIGDDYWPWNYTGWGNSYYSRHVVYQYGQNVNIGEYNMGRVAAESWWTLDMANTNYWRTMNGSISIGTLRQHSTNQADTTPARRDAWTRHTVGSVNNMGAQNDNTAVSIGDIYLNDTWTYLGGGGGTWTIAGDIKQQGNLVFMLLGWRVNPSNPTAPMPAGFGADLIIKESTLLDMIDHGQFFTRYGTYNTNIVPGSNFLLPDPMGTDSTAVANKGWAGIRQINRDNMYSEMVITDLGNGMVKVWVPEPAALGLLALGGLLMARRNRA